MIQKELSERTKSSTLSLFSTPNYLTYFKTLSTSPNDRYDIEFPTEDGEVVSATPFCLKYAKTARDGCALLVGDEYGVLTILDTRRALSTQLDPSRQHQPPIARLAAHKSAVFDACWLADERDVATASGDGSVRIFDIAHTARIGLCTGATTTVRCVAPLGCTHHVLVSGSRDGNIYVHDTRCAATCYLDRSGELCHQPVCTIRRAHAPKSASEDSCRAAGTITVTSVTPIGTNESSILSSGAADGAIKHWDLRSLNGGNRVYAHHIAQVTPSIQDKSSVCFRRPHGISYLRVSEDGRSVLACTINSLIYVYDVNDFSIGPAFILRGHFATSSYIRASFSPFGAYVAAGSTSTAALIWDLSWSETPVLQLCGHSIGEVSNAEWSYTNPLELATCADDATVRLWRAQEPLHAANCLDRIDYERAFPIEPRVQAESVSDDVCELMSLACSDECTCPQRRCHAKNPRLSTKEMSSDIRKYVSKKKRIKRQKKKEIQLFLKVQNKVRKSVVK